MSSIPVGGGTARLGSNERFISLLLQRLPQPVLNVGAGYTASAAGGVPCVNVDLVAPVPPPASAARFVQANALSLPFPDEAFGGALLKDVLEHVVDGIGLLREVRRVLHPRGRILVVTPRAIPRAVWDDPTHVRGFTRRALRMAIETSGFDLSGEPRRIGALPGASRLGLEAHLVRIMQVPGFGHWFGTNWLVEGVRQ